MTPERLGRTLSLEVLEVIQPVGPPGSFGPPFRPLSSRCDALSATAARAAEHGVDLPVACRYPAMSQRDAQEDLDRHQTTMPIAPRFARSPPAGPRSTIRPLTTPAKLSIAEIAMTPPRGVVGRLYSHRELRNGPPSCRRRRRGRPCVHRAIDRSRGLPARTRRNRLRQGSGNLLGIPFRRCGPPSRTSIRVAEPIDRKEVV